MMEPLDGSISSFFGFSVFPMADLKLSWMDPGAWIKKIGKKDSQPFRLHSWTSIPGDLYSLLHPHQTPMIPRNMHEGWKINMLHEFFIGNSEEPKIF
jgi:hypothetical protein